jgi:hypothetical protein
MNAVVSTEEELGRALKADQDTIEIHGDLVNKVLKIRATGKACWAVAITAVSIAVLGRKRFFDC